MFYHVLQDIIYAFWNCFTSLTYQYCGYVHAYKRPKDCAINNDTFIFGLFFVLTCAWAECKVLWSLGAAKCETNPLVGLAPRHSACNKLQNFFLHSSALLAEPKASFSGRLLLVVCPFVCLSENYTHATFHLEEELARMGRRWNFKTFKLVIFIQRLPSLYGGKTADTA